MPKVIAGVTMSLDGFVSDANGRIDALYPDLATLVDTEPMRGSLRCTGAVVMGRKAFAMAEDPDWFAGNYEYQVPIIVLTHHAPRRTPRETGRLTFTFVTDGIERAIAQAKAAAGGKDVTIIGGASTIQQALRAGLVDELHVDMMPVLLGGGLRPFDAIEAREFQLERLAVMELPAGRTHLRFRIIR